MDRRVLTLDAARKSVLRILEEHDDWMPFSELARETKKEGVTLGQLHILLPGLLGDNQLIRHRDNLAICYKYQPAETETE